MRIRIKAGLFFFLLIFPHKESFLTIWMSQCGISV